MGEKLYNSRESMKFCYLLLGLALALGNCGIASAAIDPTAPAAELAKRIAALSGPGPAKLVVKNRSSLKAEQVAEIRKLLERDLRGLGVIAEESGAETAATIRVTLSTNAAGGLWVAEVEEGTELRVAMIPAQLETPAPPQSDAGITLGKTLVWKQKEPILDLLFVASATSRRMIALEPERIVSYIATPGGDANSWKLEQQFPIAHARPFPRDMRGRLFLGTAIGAEHLFVAFLPGAQCSGEEQADQRNGQLAVACEDGDDPWPIPGFAAVAAKPEPDAAPAPRPVEQRAFYNSARNYFTGVLSPGLNLRLSPFYSAAAIVRPSGTAMVLSGIDGKFAMFENGSGNGLGKRLSGTRDWGSDLAAIRSGCGSGTQIVASASGTASADSLRAYEVVGREAAPVSPPLEMDGAITAIWPATDSASATVVVRREETAVGGSAPPQEDYEVVRVSAHCN
jgi:hypothetical protein